MEDTHFLQTKQGMLDAYSQIRGCRLGLLPASQCIEGEAGGDRSVCSATSNGCAADKAGGRHPPDSDLPFGGDASGPPTLPAYFSLAYCADIWLHVHRTAL